MLEEIFEGPASACAIVVAAGLSLVIPIVFADFPGRGFCSAVSLEFAADSSLGFSGDVRLVVVEPAIAFLSCGR